MDSVYCPTRVSVNFYNQYKKDDYYDLHIDEFKAQPKSNNVFFDYGFSINLEDDYEGGEFILQTPVGQITKKLKAGEMAIFPIIYPHGVAKITKGVRKNIVGWLSTNISYEQSYILHNLYDVSSYMVSVQKDMFTKANLIQNYLKKEWSK
jgi:predicted 2-oxoglutarate/Fe(II)-dependent dioxygenase YbiX